MVEWMDGWEGKRMVGWVNGWVSYGCTYWSNAGGWLLDWGIQGKEYNYGKPIQKTNKRNIRKLIVCALVQSLPL